MIRLRPVHLPRLPVVLLFAFGLTQPAHAHMGNKDVFEQVNAGPYTLFVTVRTPSVIPGVAVVEVRTSSAVGATVKSMEVTPIPLTGEASLHPPSADPMRASADDPAFFTGSLWLMASGSWQVRLKVDGSAGPATAGVAVPAVPIAVLTMQRPLGITLAILGLILTLGMAGIVAAAVRESRLTPGIAPTPARRRRALIASGATLAFMVLAIYLGDKWWNVEAASYAEDIYHPLTLHPALRGDKLDLTIDSYNPANKIWKARANDDFLLDHGKIMHLYAIRMPEMDVAYHLHPEPSGDKHLGMTLPAMPPGDYKLYADVVHRSGFPETLTADLTVPAGLPPVPLAADDAFAAPQALAKGDLPNSYKLPDGYAMVWDRPAAIAANTAYAFRFHLLDPAGKPAADMQPYLGMAGHAAFVKSDGSTFAHTHPDGTASMPAMLLANPGDAMPGMADASLAISPTVEFPYGFPAPGRYRIFIQMKHGGTVETGVFDAEVR